MSIVLVVAPHPDDETLGCGGTVLKHAARGDAVHWLIVTAMSASTGFSAPAMDRRQEEIRLVSERYGFHGVHSLGLDAARLDTLPMSVLVDRIGDVFRSVEPETVYLPYRQDVHTDHAAVFDAAVACTKWFRHPSVVRVLVYETLSETDFSLTPGISGFSPNAFVDVTDHLEEKVSIMKLYESETAIHPFPRSETAIRSLAQVRGAAAGYEAAEAFMLLKDRAAV